MIVWVLEKGVYAESFPFAVYSTAEKGIEDNPVPSAEEIKERRIPHFRTDGWKQLDGGEWDNGLDMDYAGSLIEFELDPKGD